MKAPKTSLLTVASIIELKGLNVVAYLQAVAN